MEKEIRIFDSSNNVLKVSGIIFELFEVSTGRLVSNDTSKDLNPPYDEWGVKLTFAASTGPFQVYTNDPTHKYPGNVIESLEGMNSNRIDIDLLSVPSHSGGLSSLTGPTTVVDVLDWIRGAPKWKPTEKRAVRNLFLNYVKLLGIFDNHLEKSPLADVAKNWEFSMDQLKIPYKNLR